MGGLVWLASYPKSGNTWTRHFLHNLLNGGRGHDINRLQEKTTWDSAAQWFRPWLPGDLKDCAPAAIAAVRARAQEAMAEQAGDGLLFVKTHNALMTDHGVPMIHMPVTAGAVYILRNPLDVAVSYAHHLNFSIDRAIDWMNQPGKLIDSSAHMAYELHGSWSEHVHSWTRRANPALHVMRYEDMLATPVATFTALAAFLGITADAAQVHAALEASAFERLQAMEQQQGFVEKPEEARRFFRRGESGQWRQALSDLQVRRLVDAHGEQMARFGYLP